MVTLQDRIRVRNLQSGLSGMGNRIRIRRMQLGMTQEQLGTKANISQECISKVERNSTNPKFKTIVQLCDALGIDVTEFLPGPVGNGSVRYAVVVR